RRSRSFPSGCEPRRPRDSRCLRGSRKSSSGRSAASGIRWRSHWESAVFPPPPGPPIPTRNGRGRPGARIQAAIFSKAGGACMTGRLAKSDGEVEEGTGILGFGFWIWGSGLSEMAVFGRREGDYGERFGRGFGGGEFVGDSRGNDDFAPGFVV